MRLYYWNNAQDLSQMADILKSGGIGAGSADTVVGLFADFSALASKRLDMVKKREKRPYIVLIDSFDKLCDLVDPNEALRWRSFIHSCWPGPITLILRKHFALIDHPYPSIAVRMPNHKPLLDLISIAGPLYSTSANKSGEPTPQSVDHLNLTVKANLSFLVADRLAHQHVNTGLHDSILPSVILDCTGQYIKIVRMAGREPLVAQLELAYAVDFGKKESL